MTKPYFPGENTSSSKVSRTRLGSRSHLYSSTPVKPKENKKSPAWLYRFLGAMIAIAIIIWFIFLSPFFRVKNIQIKGQTSSETKSTINNLMGRNIFLIGASRSENELGKQLPGIKEIKILRGVPDSLVINIIERKPAILWRSDGKDYLVDKDGYLYKQTRKKGYLEVIDRQNVPIIIGQRISSKSFISFIEGLNNQLKRQTGLDVNSVYIPETTYQIEVETKNAGPILKLDTTKDLSKQLKSISYIRDNYKQDVKEYIDVRVPGFAYIK